MSTPNLTLRSLPESVEHELSSAATSLALEARDLTPAGVPNTYLLVPTRAAASNAAHPRTRRFCLEFANSSPHIAAELLQGNEAQTDRFLAAYDAAGGLVAPFGLTAEVAGHRDALRSWDD